MKTEQRAHVEKKVASVKAHYAQLRASHDDFDNLLKLIYRKGYTTPAEAIFTIGMIEAIEVATLGLVQMHQALMNGAKNVVAEQEAVHA
ncbi:hypothetical protein ACPPVU_25740 [Mucilaginibacter sp. McL0603]|uniref:hypothetical protein n=1 Tax=Mucilaginibacter sp. McL0603 TaxID=3415670 RepID=UPI003CE9EB5C